MQLFDIIKPYREKGFFVNISVFSDSHLEIMKSHYPDDYKSGCNYYCEFIIRNDRCGTNYEQDAFGRSVFEGIGSTLLDAVSSAINQIEGHGK